MTPKASAEETSTLLDQVTGDGRCPAGRGQGGALATRRRESSLHIQVRAEPPQADPKSGVS